MRRRASRKQANRSERVRPAVPEFLGEQRRHEREEADHRILSVHRELVARQTAVLVAEQAKV
jgi:metal-responsive CopG/Arc/MetJ family transcriptional regulator